MVVRTFLFPGQGSQKVGMGSALGEAHAPARDVFDRIDAALSQNLFALMRDGPEQELRLTENAQPAIMAVSMATMAVLESEYGITVTAGDFVAGHSLGEYSALCAAGVHGLEDTARLLKARGLAMQAAVPEGRGAMAALLGAAMEQAAAAVEDGAKQGICAIANDNAPGQVVISGEAAAVDAAIAAARACGVRRAVLLPVSAPFHCPLMQPAQAKMRRELAATPRAAPLAPVVANVTACPETEPDRIAELLCEQITHAVRWRESLIWLGGHAGLECAEIGHGEVLTGLNRRILPDTPALSTSAPEGIAALGARWRPA